VASSVDAYLRSLHAAIVDSGGEFETGSTLLILDEEDSLGSFGGIARFEDGLTLHFLVIVDAAGLAPSFLKYRFHAADSENRCVFRYDSSPHYPHLRTFPHHKHEGADEKVVESGPAELADVLDEIRRHIAGSG